MSRHWETLLGFLLAETSRAHASPAHTRHLLRFQSSQCGFERIVFELSELQGGCATGLLRHVDVTSTPVLKRERYDWTPELATAETQSRMLSAYRRSDARAVKYGEPGSRLSAISAIRRDNTCRSTGPRKTFRSAPHSRSPSVTSSPGRDTLRLPDPGSPRKIDSRQKEDIHPDEAVSREAAGTDCRRAGMRVQSSNRADVAIKRRCHRCRFWSRSGCTKEMARYYGEAPSARFREKNLKVTLLNL
jgi:hypothetical protein